MTVRRVALLILVLTALTAPTWCYPYFARYDSGAYVMGTASLAGGTLPKVLSHPLQPPATYPPVTMVLLAPAYLLGGGSDVALRMMLALCWLATMALLAWQWWDDPRRASRLPWVLCWATASSVWLYVGRIQSEVPYLLVTVAAIGCLDRLKRDHRFWGGPWGGAALILVMLAGLTRQIGLTLAVGAALYLLWDRARWRRGLTLAVLFAVVGAAPGALLYTVTQPGQFSPEKSSVMRRDGWDPQRGQLSLVSREFLGRIKSNVVMSTQLAAGALFALDFPSGSRWVKAVFVALAALLLLGFSLQWIRGPTAVEFYIIPYLGLLLVTPWLVETRFFTVLVPWLLLYLFDAVALLAEKVGRATRLQAQRAAIGFFAALLLVAAVLVARYDFVDRWSRQQNDEATAYRWATALTAPDDVVLTRDPFAFYVLTGRRSMSYSASEQKYQPPYRLPGYLANGGRLNAVVFPESEEPAVRRRLAEARLSAHEARRRDGWVFARLAPAAPAVPQPQLDG